MNEHEHEPDKGLPEDLPQGERILWQGAPAWWPLAYRALHVRLVFVYFAVLVVWSLGADLYAGAGLGTALTNASAALPVTVLAAGILTAYAWLAHRCTVYTITTKRVVLRYGVALSVNLNLPFSVIESAALKTYRDGTGDIPLRLNGDERVSYLMLWPNVRPWHAAKPQPMLRSIPDAAKVAGILSAALADAAKQRGVPAGEIELAVTRGTEPARQQPARQQPAAA